MYDIRVDGFKEQIDLLRKFRSSRDRDISITKLVKSFANQASQAKRKSGSFIDVWSQIVPTDLETQSRVVGLRGGVAHVVCQSSAAKFELDRALREGLEKELRSAYSSTLVKVKVTLGKLNAPG